MAGVDFEVQLSEIRSRLLRVREEQGIYGALRSWVEHLEEQSGYRTSPATAMRQENGTSSLSAEYLLAVAIAEGLSPGWLLTGEGPKYAAHTSDTVELLGEVVARLQRGEITTERLAEITSRRRLG